MALISQKDGEGESVRVALAAAEATLLVDVAIAQAEAKKATEEEVVDVRSRTEWVAEEAIATVLAETEKAVDDEFGAGFFQEYSNLKKKATLAHLEWDLSDFSGVDSDYWDMEVSTEEGDPATGTVTSAAADTGS